MGSQSAVSRLIKGEDGVIVEVTVVMRCVVVEMSVYTLVVKDRGRSNDVS